MKNNPLESIHPFGKRGAEQALRIAGVLTMADNHNATYIEAETMSNAVNIVTWFLAETMRIVNMGETNLSTLDAEKVLNCIKEKGLTETTDRYLQTHCPVRNKTRFSNAINVLIEHGFLLRMRKGSIVNGRTTSQGLKVLL